MPGRRLGPGRAILGGSAERGAPRPYEEVLEEMTRRDHADSTRADSPLTLDGRYTVVDSTGLTVSEAVSVIERSVLQAAG